ncbi:universal stress protein [Nocardioides sp.]|uniref:universal stress protein n=1 Tax=Nocardioides sp. TaxID=35761 RepID=UPI0039E49ACA
MTNPQQSNWLLVGVDGSPASDAAVRYASHEARRLGAGLRIVHVMPEVAPYTAMVPVMPVEPAALRSAGHAVLHDAAALARTVLDARQVTVQLLDGPRAGGLVKAARSARLLVVGHERRSTLERIVVGATTQAVAARATCPVVAVPGDWAPGSGRGQIVVGVKNTERAELLVRRACELAAERGARLVLLHAWELPGGYDDLMLAQIDELAWSDRARHELDDVVAQVGRDHPGVQVEIKVVHGQPARILTSASAEADLLLLARRPHAFPLGHFGSTGRTLLRESRCPVEVLPPTSEPALTELATVS